YPAGRAREGLHPLPFPAPRSGGLRRPQRTRARHRPDHRRSARRHACGERYGAGTWRVSGSDAASGVTTTLANVACVAIGGRGVLIEGEPGSGKSSLALALIDRGAVLVGDDGVTLETREGRLWASPPPNIAGLIEVRNVGLVTLATGSAPVALVIRLDEA